MDGVQRPQDYFLNQSKKNTYIYIYHTYDIYETYHTYHTRHISIYFPLLAVALEAD